MMSYEEIKVVLADAERFRSEAFSTLRAIGQYVNYVDTHDLGRDLVIRALALAEVLSADEKSILMTLVRSVGLFPYMRGDIHVADLEDYIAFELHRADDMEGDIVFHSLQAKIFNQLMTGSNVVLSASTSVGKSLIIDALVASGKYRKIVIVVPTVALIDEIRRRLHDRFRETCAIITHATQRPSPGQMNIYILTQERVLSRSDLHDVDLLIVDEFYKVDISSSGERERAVDLNLAFTKLAKTGAQFYLLGPNIQDVSGLSGFEYHFIPSEFSTVAVDVVQMALPTMGEYRSKALVELCKTIDEPTIIYCQSPRSASAVAQMLASDELNLPTAEGIDDAVAWMSDTYHPDWVACEALKRGIAVHHGGIPRALQQFFIRTFNDRKLRFLVCTSTIIEGVNTVAKNVIVYDRRKSKSVLDHFTYRNIVGRAARMREYFVGRVFVLESPPEETDYSVEFAVGSQTETTPLSLLLDLEEGDLAKISLDRLDQLFRDSSLSPATLRKNRHISVSVQEAIAAHLRQEAERYSATLTWRGLPSGEQLKAACDLIHEFLESDLLADYGIYSGASLAFHLNMLRIEKDLSKYVKFNIENRNPEASVSDAVERSLRFIRNVVCQKFPRDLMVINAIQQDVFSQLKIRPGEFALFAELSENLFLPSSIFALDEYGLPIQTAQALSSRLLPAESLDDVLAGLAKLPFDRLGLSAFEVNLLRGMNLRGSVA